MIQCNGFFSAFQLELLIHFVWSGNFILSYFRHNIYQDFMIQKKIQLINWGNKITY